MVHCGTEQRKASPGYGSKEGIDGNGAVRIKAVAVDDIVNPLPEGHQTAHPKQSSSEHLGDPGNVRIGSPSLSQSGAKQSGFL